MADTVNQRLRSFIQKYYNDNKRAFATALGVSATVVENIVGTRESKPSFDVIHKLYSNVNMNIDWLLTGEGMFRRDELVEPTNSFSTKADKIKDLQEIPVFDINAAASLVSVFADKPNVIDYIHVPNLPNCDGAISVTGDSMYPIVKSGDLVAYKQQPVEYDSILFGEIYLLSYVNHGDTYIMVKYIQRSDKGDDYIKLVSHNSNHNPRDIEFKKVNALGLIKATIRYHSMS